MPKKIGLESHLSSEELEERYRGAKDPILRSHYQIIWLIWQGKTTSQVMEVTGYSRDWIQQLARRYNADGPDSLGDRRHRNPGARERALLSEEHQSELSEALAKPPADGGMWNSRKVAEWIEKKTGRRRVRTQRGWEYLRKEARSYSQGAAPCSRQGRREGARGFQKRLPMRVAKLKEAYPTAKVELWTEDEHRLGLKPVVLRKVWSRKGERPTVKVHQRYQWTYLYSFVRPHTGEVHWLILPKANVEVFSLALEHFAKEVGAGKKRRRILLVLDRAGWHTGKEVRVPEGIHLEFLPSHSPELQPAERLWPLSNEGVANRYFEELEELEEALIERCVALSDQPEIIRSYTRYHWWPKVA